MGFAAVLMNSTIPWTIRLGLPHHLDHQVSLLWCFTAQDSIFSAYNQAGDEYNSSAVHIFCSQEAQHADEQLKLLQAILMDLLAAVDLTEAKK